MVKTKQNIKTRCMALDFYYKWNMRHGLALGYMNQMPMMIHLASFKPY